MIWVLPYEWKQHLSQIACDSLEHTDSLASLINQAML